MIDDIIRCSIFYCLSMIENQYFVAEGLHQRKVMTDKDHADIFFFLQKAYASVATIMAFMECILFSASSNTLECLLRNTSSVTSRIS